MLLLATNYIPVYVLILCIVVKVVVMLLLATNYIPVVINHILMAFYTSAAPSHCKVMRKEQHSHCFAFKKMLRVAK
jgi:hypothetical protein